MQRRRFVLATSAAVVGAGLTAWLSARGREPRHASMRQSLTRDSKGVLDLWPGFAYHVVERAGDPMSDGYRVPGRPDAMACFPLGQGRLALMRNHELDRTDLFRSAFLAESRAPEEAYDQHSAGGVTRVVLDASGRRLSSNLVLAGTARNCAGGPSPWGFLSCEESLDDGHGYVFLCSTRADTVRPPQRIRAYGRCLHEAVAIDVATSSAYLTEDRGDSCLYRFVPDARQNPFGRGRFQAMAVRDKPRFDVSESLRPGSAEHIRWVDIPVEVGEQNDGLRSAAQTLGAAIVRRGEGIWFGEDGVFFTSTSGGPGGNGQILHVTLAALRAGQGGDTLTLVAQSADKHTLNMPDNITVTPWGDLMVCEDNHRDAFMRIITRDGRVIPFAHNALSASELAGACFSPDGRLMFVNIQEDGFTLAVRGPWESLRGVV